MGEVIVAKPVLIMALIDGVDSGEYTNNVFQLNEWLEKRYETPCATTSLSIS